MGSRFTFRIMNYIHYSCPTLTDDQAIRIYVEMVKDQMSIMSFVKKNDMMSLLVHFA